MNNSHQKNNGFDQQRQRNLDPDRDGLTTWEEQRRGLNPYRGDSDGDRVPDGTELAKRNSPDKRESGKKDNRQKEQLRERYCHLACSLLGWNERDTNWQTLYQDVGGRADIGKAMDRFVFERAVKEGQPSQEAAYLLAQSPYLQWHKERGQIGVKEMMEYVQALVSEHELGNSLSQVKGRHRPSSQFDEIEQ